jgi:predicted HTH domain antitoxin
MSSITVELDKELAFLLHTTPGRMEDKLKEYLVLELYRRHEISSGKAAELLGMERFEFVRYASRLGIPYLDMDEQELATEVKLAQKAT